MTQTFPEMREFLLHRNIFVMTKGEDNCEGRGRADIWDDRWGGYDERWDATEKGTYVHMYKYSVLRSTGRILCVKWIPGEDGEGKG
jgi:hypothetical protein